jgi:hypothetical protein
MGKYDINVEGTAIRFWPSLIAYFAAVQAMHTIATTDACCHVTYHFFFHKQLFYIGRDMFFYFLITWPSASLQHT